MSEAAAPAGTEAPSRRSARLISVGALLWTAQGFGMNAVATNTTQIQGALGATLTETNWLIAAYMAPAVSLTLLLSKIRTQFGLRRFTELALLAFASASLLHLAADDLKSTLFMRFLAGAAAAPISTLGFLYTLEAFSPARKMTWGLSLALTCSTANPLLARMISPFLLDIGGWHGLYAMEIGLALLCLAAVYSVKLAPVPHEKVLHRLDFISYAFVATGLGCLAIVFSLGRFYWWFEAPWIGALLALAIACLTVTVLIELNREGPMINMQWLSSPEIMHFAGVLLVFRVVLAEQGSGAIGLFQNLGLLNEQMRWLYLTIWLSVLAGGLCCALVMKPERVPAIHAVSLLMIGLGAYFDSHATSLTRPAEMFVSQAMIGFGSALFLPPAMLIGLSKTMKYGRHMLTSFIAVFLATQYLGSLFGSALFGTFVTWREKFHSAHLVEHLTLTDPQIAARVRQLAGSYGKIVADSRLLDAEGLVLLGQQATREAYVLAYNEAFLVTAILAFGALGLLLAHSTILRLRARRAAPATAPA